MSVTKTSTLTIRINPNIKEALRTTVEQEHRTIANKVEGMILDYCGRNGVGGSDQGTAYSICTGTRSPISK